MARKETWVVIETDDEENRDRNKVFYVREMGAFQGDRWAKRALLALSKVNVNLAELGDIENLGWQGVAALGMQFIGSLKWEDAEPLLAELMSCVEFVPDPAKKHQHREIGRGGADDIEEISTISKLQMEAFNLHANFSRIAGLLKSKLGSAVATDQGS